MCVHSNNMYTTYAICQLCTHYSVHSINTQYSCKQCNLINNTLHDHKYHEYFYIHTTWRGGPVQLMAFVTHLSQCVYLHTSFLSMSVLLIEVFCIGCASSCIELCIPITQWWQQLLGCLRISLCSMVSISHLHI